MKTHRLYGSIAGRAAAFRESLKSARKLQANRLESILCANAATEYGRRHGFAGISSAAQFRAHVPVASYHDFEGDIMRMAAGERDVLVPGLPLAFEETGGSCRGPKLIACTAALLEAFRRALLPWLDDLATAYSAVASGSAYWAISPVARQARTTSGGLPVGLGGDAAYFGADLGPLVLETLAVSPEVGASVDMERWRSETCRQLGACRDLALVSVWSPTFLLELAERVRLAPAVISCWDQASARPYAQALRERFPHSHVQGKGLLATEGVVSIALDGVEFPVLAADSGYFEFVDDAGQAFEAADVAVGTEYEVLMTTEGGLYRYALGDRVRVRGFAGEAPTLEFMGRTATLDLCGEKLTEAFVNSVLAPIGSRFALLSPARSGPLAYVLTVDAQEVAEAAVGPLAERVERGLAANPQYAHARALGQLSRLVVDRRDRPLQAWLQARLAQGQRLGDIKPPALSDEPF